MGRTVARILDTEHHTEGAGFVVRRPFPTATVTHIDPFLLLDEMGPIETAPGAFAGAPDHPHRGFETVSYILEGEAQHEDSNGHAGIIGPGAVQWMTAGAGIIHSETASPRMRREGGRMHGFQIWVNLPARDKMMAPRYQEIPAAKIPTAETADGTAKVKVIAGEALGARAVIDTRTPIFYLDWTLTAGARVEQLAPRGWNVIAYVFSGTALVGADARPVRDGQLAILGEGDAVRLAAQGPARLLLLGGVPLGEPVARYGPFVMNTRAQLLDAVRDYQTGRFGQIVR